MKLERSSSFLGHKKVTAQISVEISQKVLPSLVVAQSFSTRCPRFFEQLRDIDHKESYKLQVTSEFTCNL